MSERRKRDRRLRLRNDVIELGTPDLSEVSPGVGVLGVQCVDAASLRIAPIGAARFRQMGRAAGRQQ
jgi:hypothetical protein